MAVKPLKHDQRPTAITTYVVQPKERANFINGNDGGATVTFNGGASWSSIMNQPTAQFYRVITDNQTPFRLYAGQQDNSAVSIPSRTFGGGIGHEDYPVGGGESAHIMTLKTATHLRNHD